jgi:pyruvate formate lyase activating enzyme
MDACPARALVWDGRIMTVDQVMEEVIKDKVFFEHNGGCTLSGGEPLAQWDSASVLLEKLKRADIHTAIETSLYAPAEYVEAAADICDHILADCKIIDTKKHAEAAGKDNETILDNLDRLLKGKMAHKLTVRIPLVPGFTADRENITAIADFIYRRNPKVPVELLNYNPLAASKYPYGNFTGKDIAACIPYSAGQMEQFRAIVRERGIQCIESV